MAKNPRVSIYTLSREAGVSPATISRALSNHPGVSAKMRAKIKPLAAKYNFKPRTVRRKVTNICVMVQHLQGHPLGFDDYVSLSMEGIAKYCHEQGLEMSLYYGTPSELNDCDIVRELGRRDADAAVILRPGSQSTYLQQMDDQLFPYFVLDAPGLENGFSLENDAIGYEATRHLTSLGHRLIGVICDSMSRSVMQMRY